MWHMPVFSTDSPGSRYWQKSDSKLKIKIIHRKSLISSFYFHLFCPLQEARFASSFKGVRVLNAMFWNRHLLASKGKQQFRTPCLQNGTFTCLQSARWFVVNDPCSLTCSSVLWHIWSVSQVILSSRQWLSSLHQIEAHFLWTWTASERATARL